MLKKHKPFSSFFFFLSILAISFFAANCQREKPMAITQSPYLNLQDSVHYIGMNTCKECHQGIYASFMQTGMGKSFSRAIPSKSSAVIEVHSSVYDALSDFYYHPFWKQDTLKILEYRLSGKDTVYKRQESIKYIIGSGQHTNSHFMQSRGYLFQAPLTFYTQKKKWDLPPGFEKGFNSRFDRKIGLECMSCHNGYSELETGAENKYVKLANGIDCERCHGPGGLHVSEKKKGHLVDIKKTVDYTIVNPGKLSIELQLDVCQRCHLQGNAVLKEKKSFNDFRPGMHLSDIMEVYMPVYEGPQSDYIMASHAERLKKSACFLKSNTKEKGSSDSSLYPYKNGLSCVTCHNPHVSYTLTKKEVFNRACENCHTKNKVPCGEEEKARMKVKNNCASCHMPKGNTLDIPHVVTTDHYIRKPLGKSLVDKIKRFVTLRCINNTSPGYLSKANAFINQYEKFDSKKYFLDSASGLLPTDSPEKLYANYKCLVHLYYAKSAYREIIQLVHRFKMDFPKTSFCAPSLSNEDAWLNFRIGDAFFRMGDKFAAASYLKLAVHLAPGNLEFQNKYGALLVSLQRMVEAIQIFEKIIQENPKFAPALSNLGYCFLVTGKDTSLVNTLYNKALALDPDYLQALLNKAGLYLFEKKEGLAKKYLNVILKKHPGNEAAKTILLQLKNQHTD